MGVSTSEKLLPFVNQTMVDQQKVLTGFGMMSYDVVMYWYDVVVWYDMVCYCYCVRYTTIPWYEAESFHKRRVPSELLSRCGKKKLVQLEIRQIKGRRTLPTSHFDRDM